MNRTIKYRAWFPRRKEMLPVESLEFWEDANGETHAKVYAETDFERGGWYSGLRVSTNENTSLDGGKTQIPKVNLIQYTGLKDKNGTEIYEGDILSTDLSRPYLIVEFRNGAFMFQCHDNGKDCYDFMTSVDENSNFTKYHEVIGNIYEHPHFLEEVT